ncbi:MAG: glycosyltransferase family 4 protein [Clostridiales bacterium]|nr:glycosyltransferase family 4 protein [Clostridiales bacterium]
MIIIKVLMTGSTGHLTFNFTRLALALKKAGLDISICSTRNEEQKGLIYELEKSDIEWFEIPRADKFSIINFNQSVLEFKKMIHEKKFDIIHSNSFHHLLLFYAATALSTIKPKLVTTIHTTNHGTKNQFFSLALETFFINKIIDKTFTVSKETKQKLLSFGAKPNKITSIPNGIDLFFFDTHSSFHYPLLPTVSPEDVVLVTVGGLIPRKGHMYLFDAIKKLLRKKINVKLFVIGDGPEKNTLLTQCDKLGLNNSIFLLGRISKYEDLYSILKRCDIFVFPSLAELFPFAIIEAMAAEKPIVATNVGGIPEALPASERGILVYPRQPEALANKIEFLINNPSTAQEIGKNNRKQVEAHYNLTNIANKLISEYNVLISK